MTTRLKTKWRYEKDVPVCGNCANLRPEFTILRNSLPRTIKPFCMKGEFFVKVGSVCDMWNGKDGTTLKNPNAQANSVAEGERGGRRPERKLSAGLGASYNGERDMADLSSVQVAVDLRLMEEVEKLRALLREGCDGFGRVVVATSDDKAVRDWQRRVRAALPPNAEVRGCAHHETLNGENKHG